MLFVSKPLPTQAAAAAEQARRATVQALEETRDLAAQASRQVAAGVEDASAAVQWQAGRYVRRARRAIEERPFAVALVAAAAGAALAALALAALRGRGERR